MKVETDFDIGQKVYTASKVFNAPKCECCESEIHSDEAIDNPSNWVGEVLESTITDIYLRIKKDGSVAAEYELSTKWYKVGREDFYSTYEEAKAAADKIGVK